MVNILKIIAITEPSQWRWKVLVELDSETLRRLCSNVDGTAPSVGSSHDISPMLTRLNDLETRERKMKDFMSLLDYFTPKPEPKPAPKAE